MSLPPSESPWPPPEQHPAPTAMPMGWGSIPYPAAEPPPPPAPLRGAGGGGPGLLMLGVFLLAEVLFLLFSVLVIVPFAVADPDVAQGGSLPVGALVLGLTVPTTLAALVAVAGTAVVSKMLRLGRTWFELALSWRWRDVGIGLAFGVGGMILTIPASALWARYLAGDDANSAVGEIFDGVRLSWPLALMVLLAVWLVAPLCEEILFRGVLWRAFEHLRWNRWVIAVVTSVVFSFAHLELLRTPLLLVISIPIALSRVLTGNLLSSVVAHQANNFLPAVGLFLLLVGVSPT